MFSIIKRSEGEVADLTTPPEKAATDDNGKKTVKAVVDDDEKLSFNQRVQQKWREYCVWYYIGLNADDAPNYVLYSFTIVSWTAILAVFIYFFVTGYLTSTQKTFVSIETNAGECDPVPQTLSTYAQGSIKGYWAGSANYSDNEGAYNINLNNLALKSDAEFTSMMNSVFYDGFLKNLSSNAVNQTLVVNLLYWINFHYQATYQDNMQTFEFNGIPSAIFDVKYRLIGLASHNHNCRAYAVATWNLVLGVVDLTWNLTEFNSHNCEKVVSPYLLGYNNYFYRNRLPFSIDLNALTSAVAFNYGLIPFDVFIPITSLDGFKFNGVTYAASLMLYARFPQMQLMYCVNKVDGEDTVSVHPVDQYCFMYLHVYGEKQHVPVIPIFSHWGFTNETTGDVQPCTCPMQPGMEDCDEFIFVTSLIVFPDTYNASTGVTDVAYAIESAMNLVTSYSVEELHALTHPPVVSSMSDKYSSWDTQTDDNYAFNANFSFCNNECSVLILKSYLGNGRRPVTGNYFQLINGACSDSFSGEWDLLISSPPVAVVQTYVSCVLDAADATLNSLGIASGNAQIAAPIILMCLFIIIYVMEQLHLFPKLSQRRRYTVDDYRDILDEFGQCLLDAKNREIGLSKESDGSECVLRLIAEEMNEYEKHQHKHKDTGLASMKLPSLRAIQHMFHMNEEFVDKNTENNDEAGDEKDEDEDEEEEEVGKKRVAFNVES